MKKQLKDSPYPFSNKISSTSNASNAVINVFSDLSWSLQILHFTNLNFVYIYIYFLSSGNPHYSAIGALLNVFLVAFIFVNTLLHIIIEKKMIDCPLAFLAISVDLHFWPHIPGKSVTSWKTKIKTVTSKSNETDWILNQTAKSAEA